VLAGLMISSDLLACAPEDTLQKDTNSLIFNIQEDSKYSEKSIEESSHNTSSHHNHSNEDSESHHECDCCEFCRCTSCTDCTICASATLSLSLSTRLDKSIQGKIFPLSSKYLSQSPTPLYHPPILTLIFLA